MTDYNEEIDEFAPAKPDLTQPAKIEPESVKPDSEPMQPAQDDFQQVQLVEKPNAYESIFEQQNEQINALIAQNKSLTEQITQLIANGAQIGQQQTYKANPMSMFNAPALADSDDWSLESLAKDIGKHPKH